MSHTKFKNGQIVKFTESVVNKAKELAKDKFWINELGQELMDQKVIEAQLEFEVKVVTCGHTLNKIVQITRPGGRTSNIIDECLILVK